MYRSNVWKFFLVHALNHFLLWLPIWVVFLERKGLSLTQIGLFDAFVWLAMAALEIPTGGVADRWGRKASMFVGTFLNAVAMLLVLTETLSPAFLLGYFLWGGAFTFISGADLAFLYDSLKADGRTDEAAKQNGRYTAVLQASQGVAAILGAAIATIDLALCFVLTAAFGFIAAGLVLTFREPPRLAEGERALPYWSNLRVALGIALRDRRVRWLILLTALLPVVPFVINFVLIQPYALSVGLPLASLGLIVAASRTAGVFGSAFAHRTTGRIALVPLTFASIVITVASAGALAVAPAAPLLVLVPVITFVGSVVRPLLVARLNDLIPSAQRATIISLGSLVFTLALAFSEPLIMRIADIAGAATALGAAALAFAAAVFPFAVLWRAAERGEPMAPTPGPLSPEPIAR